MNQYLKDLKERADNLMIERDTYYDAAFGIIPVGFNAKDYAIGKVVEHCDNAEDL